MSNNRFIIYVSDLSKTTTFSKTTTWGVGAANAVIREVLIHAA